MRVEPPSFIMVHHSLTRDGQTVSWQAIRRYHMQEQKWSDIGYHAGIELVGSELECLIGRPEDLAAAACREDHMNERALHVCCVGNYDEEAPSDALLHKLARYIVIPWMARYGIPVERIVPHRDYATYKSCPGKQFDMARLWRLCR